MGQRPRFFKSRFLRSLLVSSIFIAFGKRLRRIFFQNQFETAFYLKLARYHLFASRLYSSYAWKHERDYQVVLGGTNGLRGYPDRYYSGTKMLLLNVEYRVFSPLTIMTVGVGGAAFFDAGYVWSDRQNMKLRDLKKDIGVGLRFGLTNHLPLALSD
jgi:outer membrane translocation and assembly module TamA